MTPTRRADRRVLFYAYLCRHRSVLLRRDRLVRDVHHVHSGADVCLAAHTNVDDR